VTWLPTPTFRRGSGKDVFVASCKCYSSGIGSLKQLYCKSDALGTQLHA